MAQNLFAKVSRGGNADANAGDATEYAVEYNKKFVLREPPRQRGTGYTANIRPVLQYVATNDDSKAFGVLCDPKHNYGCTTKTTYTPPNTWNHGQPRNINDITTRLPLANGFVKDIPITLPNSTQAPRNFQMTTRATYNPKPYHPQPTEPRRGLEWTEETYKNDWQKTRSSVYNKERHGQDIITSRNQFREGEQEATRHLAAATETTQKFVTPQHPSTKELPNLVPQRAPYDRSGNTGNNSFTMSTHARPVYLTDPRKDSDGKWNVNGNTVSGAAQLARTARTDPMEYLNMTKGPSVTTTGNFHARKATTREVADNQAEVGFVQKVGKKTTSGYGSNNIATAAYLPERQEAYNSTYSTNHSMAFNYSMPQRVKETQNVSPVKDNGFVRGTLVNQGNGLNKQSIGQRPGALELDMLRTAHPQVVRGNLMRDPFIIDTRHSHKTRQVRGVWSDGGFPPQSLVATTSRV